MIRGLVSTSLGRKARGAARLLIAAAPLLTAQTKEAALTLRVADQVIERWPDGQLDPQDRADGLGF